MHAVGPSDISTGQGGGAGSQQCCAPVGSESPLAPGCPPCMQTLGCTRGGWPSSDGAGLWGRGFSTEGVLGEAVWGGGFHRPLPMASHTSFLALSLLRIQPPSGVRRHLRAWPWSEAADCPCCLLPAARLTMSSALSLAEELGAGALSASRSMVGFSAPLSSLPWGSAPPFLFPAPWERVHLARP